ncbi:aldo/keto reductase [Nakamurella sp.]|uniref:aldo/keto reductase n=1 Tax=Nakamurella sp. TaxID=1869182 RepID=UPI003B3B9AB0
MVDPIFSTPSAHRIRRPSGRRRARWALGTAVLGRPAYINTGSAGELPADRSVESYRAHTAVMLDAAVAAGVDWIDTARSYGRAEEFVGDWWRARAAADPDWVTRAPTVSSKWGYRYVGDWDMQAAVHEVKDHSVAHFREQLALTRACLPRFNLYQVHSLTLDSPLFEDDDLLRALGALRDDGVAIGFSSSGARQGEIIRRAMEIDVDGARLFSAVQATWNLLEPSAGPALREASRRELTVIVKESLANGRLVVDPPAALRAAADRHGATVDAVALAAVAQQPWADRVLLGAAGVDQLHANLRADAVELAADELTALVAELAMDPADYWQDRSALSWH